RSCEARARRDRAHWRRRCAPLAARSRSLAALSAFPQAISILDAGSLREGTELLATRVTFCIASERFARQVADKQKTSQRGISRKSQNETAQISLSTSKAMKDMSPQEHQTDILLRYASLLLSILLEWGIRIPTITLGEQGCCFAALPSDSHLFSLSNSEAFLSTSPPLEGPACYHLEAYPVQAVDTTGAGDIFHGACAAALLWGYPYAEALRIASLAAAISVQQFGGRPSIPPSADILALARTWKPTWHPLPLFLYPENQSKAGGTYE
ncbi:MAG: PfkB family carbohydrate kinase, partial [Spirochaetales bacterium]